METRHPPVPHLQSKPAPPVPARPTVEASPAEKLVRVSILNEQHDEEEKEAGYGYGV